jgi:hypothetical protein
VIDIGRVGLWTGVIDPYPTSRVRDVVQEVESIDVALERVAAQHAAGADHVAIQVLSNNNDIPMQQWHDLAEALGLG